MADIVIAVTGYPGTLDTRTTLTDGASGSDQNAIQINGPASAILALETELGTQPRGTATDVRTRLDRGIASAGTILRTASAWGTTYGDGDIWIGSAASNSMELGRLNAGQGITITRGAHSATVAMSSLVGTVVATQAQMEAATDLVNTVTAGRTQFHPGVGKAWVVFDGTGTPTIHTSYNTAAIVDRGLGNWDVNWTTAFSAASYACCITANVNDIGLGAVVTSTRAASAALRAFNNSAAADSNLISVMAMGDQ